MKLFLAGVLLLASDADGFLAGAGVWSRSNAPAGLTSSHVSCVSTLCPKRGAGPVAALRMATTMKVESTAAINSMFPTRNRWVRIIASQQAVLLHHGFMTTHRASQPAGLFSTSTVNHKSDDSCRSAQLFLEEQLVRLRS